MKTYYPELSSYNDINFKKNYNKISSKLKLLAYPCLLSKSYLSGNPEYWDQNINQKLTLRDFLNLIRIPRILLSYISIIIYFFISSIRNKKIAFLLTRAAGIHSSKSLDDFRFDGLSKELNKKNIMTIYYIFDNSKLKNPINLQPKLFHRDVIILAKLQNIFELVSQKIIRKNFFKEKLWEKDLELVIKSSRIISKFTKFSSYSFFWDFNYQNYPFFLGSYLSKNKLIGSMHAFHNSKHMPWMSSDCVKNTGIKHFFNDYKSINDFSKKDNKAKNKNIKKVKSKKIDLKKISDLVIIQENQLSQEDLIQWLSNQRIKERKIHVKFRPDNADADFLIKLLEKYGINWSSININKKLNSRRTIYLGKASTYLLDLALNGENVMIFGDEDNYWFKDPSRDFVDLYSKINNSFFNKFRKEYKLPVVINHKKIFHDLSIKENDEKELINILMNHYLFRVNKIKILKELF